MSCSLGTARAPRALARVVAGAAACWAMMRAMVTYLFETGKIETTVTRAKEVRTMAEKMVTLGKNTDLHSKRQVFGYITKETVAKKVIDEVAPRYMDRAGGYTRITKIGVRAGWVPVSQVVPVLMKK